MSDGDLRLEIITAYNLVVDSNVESPSTYAPRAAFIGAKIWNDGTNALTNIVVNIGNYIDGINDTPGLYPTNRHPAYPTIVGPLPSGTFALTHEGGAAGTGDATRHFRKIPARDYVPAYWLISYPNVDINGKAVWGPSVKPDDDLKLDYDIWAKAQDDGTTLAVTDTRTVTMRNEISAMANKILPNTANKVPQEYQDMLAKYFPSWSTAASDGSPGSQIVAEGVWYDLGNVGHGFDNDGDLVPDKNAWMQPVGDAGLFDASCFRLVHTYALVIVKLKTGGEDVIYVEDELYFENIPDNNGAVGWVGYEFVPLRGGCGSALSPYQEVASGFDNEKFNGDYGAALGALLTSKSSSVDLAKTADGLKAVPGDTIRYALTFTPARTNFEGGGTLTLGNPDLGLPVVLQDRIPDGSTYIAGSASSSNDLPVGVGSYTVLYSTNNAASWEPVEPPLAASVTDLRWWLSDQLVAGTTGTVRFAVSIDTPFTLPEPRVCNTGGVSFGETPPDTNSTFCTWILGTNTLGDTVYADDGTGGGVFGNQVQDAGEPGLSNVTVTLYVDVNSNGVHDIDDLAWDYLVTDASGTYTFTNLPDGHFVAVVDYRDPDLPTGYTLTTPETHVAALDPDGTNANTVAYTDADFGFAPVLALSKELVGSSPVYEGAEVTFKIVVNNQFLGDGSGTDGALSVMPWATLIDTIRHPTLTGWNNDTNALYAPDDLEAWVAIKDNSDELTLSNFNTPGTVGSITNVTVNIDIRVLTPKSSDYLYIDIWNETSNTSVRVSTNTADTLPADGVLSVDITETRPVWQWTDFGSNITVVLTAQKSGGPGGSMVYVDAVSLSIETDEIAGEATGANTLDPVPLNDTYDADLLQYVSSTPPASVSRTTGSAPNTTGTLEWNDVGPINPGGSSTVLVTFAVMEPPSNQSTTVTNTAFVNSATFSNGIPANSATDEAAVALQPTAVIGDTVWRDLDGNGVQDSNEVGIANVLVTLLPPAGVDAGNGAGVAVTNTTDSDGGYLFDGLIATNYTVTVLTNSLPGGGGINTWDRDGNNNSVTDVTVTNAPGGGPMDVLDADFGYQVDSVIEGLLWHDENRNAASTPDTGEDRFSDVTVNLYSATNLVTPIASTNTDASGYFLFAGSYTGDFVVVVSTNTGDMAGVSWTASYDTDGTGTVDTATVSVVSGGSARADYSYHAPGVYRIGDTLFFDWNGDGAQQVYEEGIPDVTLSLYSDDNSNGVVDAGSDLLLAAEVTATNGIYLFSLWPADDYIVIVDTTDSDFPASLTCTADPDATPDGRGSLTLSADNLAQDFGYQPSGAGRIGDTVWKDMNADGTQSGPNETGIADISVVLYVDLNADGVFSAVATNQTDSSGNYLFTDLPDANYRLQVDTGDADIPTDPFGVAYEPSTVTRYSVTISDGNTFLDADFGFRPLGAIGDTIFWDMNASGTQDAYESGVSNVTVFLYRDINTNRLFDAGTDTLVTSNVTDGSGLYLFAGLTNDRYVVVVETNASPLAGTTLTADPDADGLPCTDPAVTNGCDSAYGVPIETGTWFMGADFGYQPLGVLGDTVWLDVNTNGVRDAGEYGIPYITVELWTNGTLIATNVTDADGMYIFGGLDDDTYRVVVNTDDTDWPTEVVQVYDPDDTLDDQASAIVVSNGHVATIGGITYTNDLDVDFGYRYDGSNILSGTVGLDALPYDGALGDGANSGVTSNEAPFPGVTVYLYLWRDDGDASVEPDETVAIANTTTDANGDYRFSSMPSGGISNYYIVALSAPAEDLLLTTVDGSTPSLWLVSSTNDNGTAQSAYHVVTIQPISVNIDFAFALRGAWDFGDLPDSYSTSLAATPQGARHRIPATPDLFMGLGIDAEPNGQVSTNATGDNLDAGGDDEKGVTGVFPWNNGTTGGVVTVTIGAGSGWLVGWMDFDQSGAFSGSGELIVSQAAAATGSPYTIAFDIPAGTLSETTNTVLRARFRLFASEPSLPEAAYAGMAVNGEVEDYTFTLLPTLVVLSAFDASIESDAVMVRWETAVEVGSIGFFVERLTDAGWSRVNTEPVPAALIYGRSAGVYSLLDASAPTTGEVNYRLRELDNRGGHNLYGPFSFLFDGHSSLTQWLRGHFNNAVNADADSDGDGMSNRAEFIAGTDPRDPASRLRIRSIARTTEGVELRWDSVPDRRYRLRLQQAPGTPGSTPYDIPTTPPVNVYTDSVQEVDLRMYRLGVEF